MKSRKRLAKLLVLAMALTSVPFASWTASAADGDQPWYVEDFEDTALVETIKAKQDGWNWEFEGNLSNPEDMRVFDGEGRSDSNIMMFSNGNNWHNTGSLTLDLKEAGVAKAVAGGAAQEEAEAAAQECLTHDLTISLKGLFERQDKDHDQSESYLRLIGQNHQVIAELAVTQGSEKADGVLSLIALNAEKTRNEAYKIADINIGARGTDWQDISVDLDLDQNVYRLTVNGAPFTGTPHGEWIPAGSKAGIVPALPQAIGQLKAIQTGMINSGWYETVYWDDLSVTPGTFDPSVSPGPDVTPVPTPDYLYYQDFEGSGMLDTIRSKEDGWGYDTDDTDVGIGIVKTDIESTFGGDGKSFRFASGNYYKNCWLTLDLQEAATSQGVAAGMSQSEAAAEAQQALKKSASVSFMAKIDDDGENEAEKPHEAYFRVKGADYHPVTELRMREGELFLVALNAEKDGNEEYKIKEIDRNKNTSVWDQFQFDFDFTDNTYRLLINGEPFTDTPHGEWIPAGTEDGNVAAKPTPIGELLSLEYGHTWSAFYQAWHIDNLGVAPFDNGGETKPTPGPTSEPTATPEPTPVPENLKYMEDFESKEILDTVKNQEKGWGWAANEGQEAMVDLSLVKGPEGGKALRLQSLGWYKTLWANLNLLENGTEKKVGQGSAADAARADVTEYLSKDMKLSLDARFSTNGFSGTNVQYIQINGSDGHGIAGLYIENTEMKLVALNEAKTANVAYKVKTVENTSTTKEWDHIEFYFNHEKNAYMLKVNDEIFNDNPHGKWIPASSTAEKGTAQEAPLGMIQTLEFGHSYTGWEQSMTVDNIKVETYEKIQETYEVREVQILNANGSTSITPGSTVRAKIYTDGGTTNPAKTVINWFSSTDGGITWLPMDGDTLPQGVNRVKVEVSCTSFDGSTSTGSAAADVTDTTEIDYIGLFEEHFDGKSTQDAIRNQKNGWKIKGSSNQVDVGSFGGTNNSVRFASLSDGGSNILTLDLSKQGYETANKQTYVKFGFSFGLSGENEVPKADAIYFIDLCDTKGNIITSLSLIGDQMTFIYYDDQAAVNKTISLASGKGSVIDVWRTAEFYVDAEANRFSLLIDGNPVGPENGKWMQASTNAIIGRGEPNDIDGIGSILLGQENASWWGCTLMGALDVKAYQLPTAASAKFSLTGVEPTNAFDAGQPLANGSPLSVALATTGGTVANENFQWSYQTAGATQWIDFDGSAVPWDAAKVKVNASATSIYGESGMVVAESAVTANTAPSIDNLSIKGEFQSGQTLTAEYTFTDLPDAEEQADHSTFEWYRTEKLQEGFVKIPGAAGKSYTLTDADSDGFIKVVVTPVDRFGAKGEAKEVYVAQSDAVKAQAALDALKIPARVPKGVASIDLPDSDPAFGAVFDYQSSNSSVFSDSGVVSRPVSGDQPIALTVTATVGTARVNAIKHLIVDGDTPAPTPKPGGGGGGGGGGGSRPASGGGIGNISTPNITPPTTGPDVNEAFLDVGGDDWFAPYVMTLTNQGVISRDRYFRPDDSVTRAEFVKMIVEMLGIKDSAATADFSDVSGDDWSYVYIASATKFGIVNGVGDGTFGAAEPISREDMAVIIDRAAALKGAQLQRGEPEFTDQAEIADYARGSVGSMQASGLIEGYEGAFSPKGNTTRAEAAKVICKVMELE